MGANAQTTVPTFTAGDVLTAAQMNQSARTGVPVFANTSDRDAAFGGTGEKTLAEGQLCYLEDANIVQYYDGASWATVGPDVPGLTLVKTQTIGSAVSSVTVSDAFSSTYDNYRIMLAGGAASGGVVLLNMTLGATTSGYYNAANSVSYAGVSTAVGTANGAAIPAGQASANSLSMIIDVLSPNLANETMWWGSYMVPDTGSNRSVYAGYLNNTTQYTAFTLTPGSGTITGGIIKVYGYKN